MPYLSTIADAAGVAVDVAGQPWYVGALIATVVTLAGVIVFLFKRSDKRDRLIARERDEIIKERESWTAERLKLDDARTLEREEIRGEFEVKHRELVEHYLQQARSDRDAEREHITALQKEFADIMEAVAAESGKASQALVDVLTKFHTRFVGPRRGY